MSLTAKQKPSIHHRRAHGKHHKHDEHYLKAYHPYLPLLLLIIVGLAINVFWTTQAKVLGASTSITPVELLQDTNTDRTQNHESGLLLNDKLNAAAQAKANDMVARNYWSHNTPDGQQPWTFVQDSGYSYRLAGENLAYGFMDADSVVTGWMNSPEHRANILTSGYQEAGFGVASSQNFRGNGPATIVVAFYAAPNNGTPGVVGTTGSGTGTFASAESYRSVSRVQMFTGGHAPWSFIALLILTIAGAGIFLIRHVRAWQKVLGRGEAFVLHHKTFDLVILSLVLIGVVMTRAAGFIG